MSDRAPRVTVEEIDGKWIAKCWEPGCPWAHRPDEKTYVSHRAKAHRAMHRRSPGVCGATTAVHIGNQTPMDVRCWRLAGHDGRHAAQTLDSDDNPVRYEWSTRG
jgi:hypothetical protein